MSVRFPRVVHAILLIILCWPISACSPGRATAQATLPAGDTPAPAEATAVPTAAPAQPTQAAAQPMAFDACALLTRAEAEKILGQPVKDPEHPVQGSETFIVDSCTYHAQNGTAMDRVSLIVVAASAGDAQSAKIAYDTGKNDAQTNWGAAPVDVPGLGDAAYWVAGAGNDLFILQGSVQVTLGASSQKGDTPSPEILDLAKLVLSRIH